MRPTIKVEKLNFVLDPRTKDLYFLSDSDQNACWSVLEVEYAHVVKEMQKVSINNQSCVKRRKQKSQMLSRTEVVRTQSEINAWKEIQQVTMVNGMVDGQPFSICKFWKELTTFT